MTNTKTFRLFISSPFSDFKDERKILHENVFPVIEKHCSDEGFQFQPIDLRWGVNNESQLDQKTLDMCLDEVKACKGFPHPHFLIMQGDRYGYIPLPYMIEEGEFDKITKYVNKRDTKITITYKDHVDKDGSVIAKKESRTVGRSKLLHSWYTLDKNQIPASYVLNRREGDYEIYPFWEAEEITLRTLLQYTVENIFDDKEDKAYQKYFLSATEQEVIEGVYDYKELTTLQQKIKTTGHADSDKAYIFGYIRTIKGIKDNYVDEEDVLKKRAKSFKSDLKRTLLSENTLEVKFDSVEVYKSSLLDEFAQEITNNLLVAVDAQIQAYAKSVKKPLSQEVLEQEAFKDIKSKNFTGRTKILNAISTYVKSS